MDVTLVWAQGDGEDKAVVCVCDKREGAYFEIPTERHLALDVVWQHSPMVQVGTYPTRSDAELAQTALTAAGIPSVVSSDDAGGAYPFDLSGGARLLVDEADADRAASILDTAR